MKISLSNQSDHQSAKSREYLTVIPARGTGEKDLCIQAHCHEHRGDNQKAGRNGDIESTKGVWTVEVWGDAVWRQAIDKALIIISRHARLYRPRRIIAIYHSPIWNPV